MKLTRQTMAGIAFALLLIAVVALHFAGTESAKDVAERLEGAMGMALAALLGETVLRARGGVTGTLLVLGLVCIGCGASAEEVRETACTATRVACTACEVAEERYCGGAEMETEASKCGSGGEEPPAIDRVYEPADDGET